MRIKNFQIVFVTVLTIIVDATLAKSYKKKCKNGGVIIESGVFDFQKKDIVDRHNLLRRQVAKGRISGQPKASNLLYMMWDKKLERDAKRYAEQCEENLYDLCPRNELRFNVGVNSYVQQASRFNKAANWLQVMNEWFNEHTHYNFHEMQHNNYSQMVWAKTYMIGCAYTYYSPAKGKDHIKIYLCLYGPGGNHKGVTAYRPGTGCSNLCHIDLPEKESTVKVAVDEVLFIHKTPGKYHGYVKSRF